MTASLDVTQKTTERNRIVRTNKSEAEVTNNKKLRSRYHIIEATKLTDRPEASRGLFATAELLVHKHYYALNGTCSASSRWLAWRSDS